TLYELYLRYYVLAQRWAGVPHAWQTIGSSMAVRCDAYQQQGGMNRRQAGEDFYFLHKYIPLGGFSEISATKILPSPRPSHRVPFGTGKAVGELLRSGVCQTYHPSCFCDLKAFFKQVPSLFNLEKCGVAACLESLPESVRRFLAENDFEEKLAEIQSNTTTRPAFQKRFFRWFDAFLLMKYVHFARENFHPEMEVTQAAKWLLADGHGWQAEKLESASAKDLLLEMRQLEKCHLSQK
ncbi:MAG: glycosyltransferase family 2 protein, partial [Bacteroidota bacterium]